MIFSWNDGIVMNKKKNTKMKTKKTWITEFLGLSLPERNWWDFAPLGPVNKFQQRSLVEEADLGSLPFFR